MTVLLVLLTFAVFIALDLARERRREARHQARWVPMAPSEPAWVAGFQLPEDRHYHPGHTWVRVVEGDTVAVGVDDFARRLVGPAERLHLPAPGDWLRQGGKGFALQQDGRSAEFAAPVEGEVVQLNAALGRRPSLATEDPYGNGWLFKVRVHDLAANLRNLLDGGLARRWTEASREALDLRLIALSGSVLQDGGEPAADFARHLDDDAWRRLVSEFLRT